MGMCAVGSAANWMRQRWMVRRSAVKSSSRRSTRSNSRASATGRYGASIGMRRSTSWARFLMMSRSALTTLAMSGRRTFSATVRPSRRTARWTCEIDAEATGIGSSAAKTSDGRPPVLLAQDLLDLVERERADVRAQRRQLVDVRLGEQVGPGAQELAQLHEGRPEVLQDQPQPAGPILRRDPAAQRDPLDRPHQALQVQRRHHILVAVSHQGRQDLPVSRQVAEMTDRLADHA